MAAFERYARRYGLADIHFIGKVSPEDLPRYYRSAAIFSAPSTGSESFGIILLEAMAAGVPVVASGIAGYRSVLTGGTEGLLVEPGDGMAIAGAISGLLEAPERRSRMAAEGQRTAQEYDWGIVASRVLDYYQELVESRAGPSHEVRRKRPALDLRVRPVVKIGKGKDS